MAWHTGEYSYDPISLRRVCSLSHINYSGIILEMETTTSFLVRMYPVATNKSRDPSRVVRTFPRSGQPPKYYLPDFIISLHLQQDALPAPVKIVAGANEFVPEYKKMNEPSDLSDVTDVHLVGELIRQHSLQVSGVFSFLNEY
jgi:hypothetical protein